jgi:oligo-1,6-glucosidase
MMNKKWWHNKVAYQIYPKSFKDTNGDGIGDIPGIISKLDYLKDLGVDILWISPMYQSPMVDNGYDISDYYAIDPMFGSMDEMKQLIKEAKKRNMYILMDLVVNHCSSEHEWFQKAMADPEGNMDHIFISKTGKMGSHRPTGDLILEAVSGRRSQGMTINFICILLQKNNQI